MPRSIFSTPKIGPWAVVRSPSRRTAQQAMPVSNGKSVRGRPCPMANEREGASDIGRAAYEVVAIRHGAGNDRTQHIVVVKVGESLFLADQLIDCSGAGTHRL